jgi:hypothetical protein
MKYLLLLLTSLLVIGYQAAHAQEFNCDVTVDVQQLATDARENLGDFANVLKQYINNTKWTNEDFQDDKLHWSISIALSGSGSHYKASTVIVSDRPIFQDMQKRNCGVIRLKDDNWEFDYVRAQPLNHDEFRFDPLMSFIDFYAFLVLGYDGDTWDVNGGTPYFEKAMEIVNKARNGNGGVGWEATTPNTYTRGQLVGELLNSRYRDLREAVYRYHYHGLDLLYKNPEKAKKNILAALEKIAKMQEKLNEMILSARLFWETKYHEIADTFVGYADLTVFSQLTKFDQAHRSAYEEASSRR